MALQESSTEFAASVTAGLGDQPAGTESQGGAPSEKGHDPAGMDPAILAVAKSLVEMQVPPEKVREVIQTVTSLQTPEGQRDMMQRFLSSEQGKTMKESYGKEYLSALLASPGGGQRIVEIAKEFGYDPTPAAETDDTQYDDPGQRKVQAIERQMAALQAELRATQSTSAKQVQELQGRLQNNDAAAQRKEEFFSWAQTRPPMSREAYTVLAKRAYELAHINPSKYAGSRGFTTAINDALADYTSTSAMFAPKRAPRSLRSEGGGVAGNAAPDRSKLSLDQQIALAAEDIALDVNEG